MRLSCPSRVINRETLVFFWPLSCYLSLKCYCLVEIYLTLVYFLLYTLKRKNFWQLLWLCLDLCLKLFFLLLLFLAAVFGIELLEKRVLVTILCVLISKFHSLVIDLKSRRVAVIALCKVKVCN